jgi:hypothetical protein
MEMKPSNEKLDRGIGCAMIRLLLIAVCCAEWAAVWVVVYCPILGP